MTFKWSNEATLCLKAVGIATKLFDAKVLKKQPFRTKESTRDVVTALDLSIERGIHEILAQSPYPIIGEELTPQQQSHEAHSAWFVDPIDGTANYLHGIPFFGSSIGLMSKDAFTVGAVVFPALHELYFVSDSGESFMNGNRLNAVPNELTDSLIGMAFSSREQDPKTRVAEFALFGSLNDGSRGCLRTGSAAVNVCYVAANKLQAAVGIRNKLWDVAGSLAIACAAGCELYYSLERESNKISYVIGSTGVADVIASKIEAYLPIKLTQPSKKELA